MTPSLTDVLCTRCALCCDGSLFADVELAGRREATGLEVLGLEIEDGDEGALLLLPCRALQGRRCGIYPHRPKCCRTFECRLLPRVQSGKITSDAALKSIAEARRDVDRVRELVRQLGQNDERMPLNRRYSAIMAQPLDPASDDETAERRSELMLAVHKLTRILERDFL